MGVRQLTDRGVWVAAIAVATMLGSVVTAAAHCDTLDGPVIQDARKALETKEVTPVLKWVKERDEKPVRAAFSRALAAKGKKSAAAEEKRFFAELVRIHRAGEGASFTGLKPAGSVEPAVAEADMALSSGSPEALLKTVGDAVAQGIRERFEKAAAAYRHKDESVAAGREFVEAYVDYTHYVERLHLDAVSPAGHGEHQEKNREKPAPPKHRHH